MLAGILAVFAKFERDILRDRVKASIAEAKKQGKPYGRPATIMKHEEEIRMLFAQGVSKRESVLTTCTPWACTASAWW